MKRLLLIAETYYPRIGGGVRYEIDLINHFRSLGYTCDIITVGEDRKTTVEKEDGGVIIRLPNSLQFSTARISLGMPSYLLRHHSEYDLFHFNAPNPLGELSYLLTRTIRKTKVKTVCSFHGEVVSTKPFYNTYNQWLLKSHLGACNRVIASSPQIVKTTPLLSLFKEKVAIIPYGIDTKKFCPKQNWSPGVPNRSLKYLFVGRLVRYKGLFVLLDAMVNSKGLLDIVGEGPLKSDLVSKVKENKLQDRVIFRDRVSDEELLQFYQNADVVTLPSIDRGESYGYVLVEGMACGACAISTELGTGTSFVNSNGETGIVVKSGDVQGLTQAMNFLENNRGELTRFRKNALKRANKMFSKENMLKSTENLYKELGLGINV